MKKRILFVGEHPFSSTGNANMMRGVLSQADREKFDITVFAVEPRPVDPIWMLERPMASIIPANSNGDPWGRSMLLDILNRGPFDALVFVGIDIWRYIDVYPAVSEIKAKRKFKTAAIFPFDLQEVRNEWVGWIEIFDFPCVYSRYGERKLKGFVDSIRYFRPPLFAADTYRPMTDPERLSARKIIFPRIAPDRFVFGFVGVNQIRKDPQRLLMAFALAKKRMPDICLYLHTDMTNGAFNLKQFALDCGLTNGDLFTRHPNSSLNLENMATLYNAMDCLVNCTMQEGLSWTPLEAMLCGTPVIASATTAQTELVENAALLVPCDTLSFIPLRTRSGESWVEAKSCEPKDIAHAMVSVARDAGLRSTMREAGLEEARKWLNGVSDIDALLSEMTDADRVHVPPKKNAVLFAQHSSAGDVLMTTRCFKGLGERHGGLPIVYMTSPQYMDIVAGNPYLSEIIPWNERELDRYRFKYNPHGDRILPGHWGRNSNSILSDFYWKILMVEPGEFFIEEKEPPDGAGIDKETLCTPPLPLCIVHTTGGVPGFRTYRYMADVCAGLKGRYLTVQLGGGQDYPAGADLDLRGRLTYRESAWVMRKARLAVTVDSFVSHLAGAFGVSQVCLFGSGNHNVVRPNQVSGVLICMVPDYVRHCPGLGPCSGVKKDCPAKCTGLHDPKEILCAIKQIEEMPNEAADDCIQYAK